MSFRLASPSLLFSALALLALSTATLRAQEFIFAAELDHQECGTEVVGRPGEEIGVDFTVYLESSEPGVSGFGVAVRVVGDSVVRLIEHECDEDCHAHHFGGMDGDVFFQAPVIGDPGRILTQGPDAGQPQGHSFTDGMALKVFPPPAFTLDAGKYVHHLFRVFLRVPEEEQGERILIQFYDGLVGQGEPITNGVTWRNETFSPRLDNCEFTLRPARGLALPGDMDKSDVLDITDAVSLWTHIALGFPDALPCEGTIRDHSNITLMDFNGDHQIDISDPISILYHLFLGGAPHVLGRDCVAIPGCFGPCDQRSST